jgi:hypothetical protein
MPKKQGGLPGKTQARAKKNARCAFPPPDKKSPAASPAKTPKENRIQKNRPKKPSWRKRKGKGPLPNGRRMAFEVTANALLAKNISPLFIPKGLFLIKIKRPKKAFAWSHRKPSRPIRKKNRLQTDSEIR